MKLPKNYFENLSTMKYRQYLKLLPDIKKESNKTIIMLIFTFLSMSFLGIFAINPTLGTIVDLHKQLEDSKFVYENLTTKINNLSSLQAQYSTLSNDIPIVMDAIPQTSAATMLAGQLQALAGQQSVTITTIRIDEIQLSKIIKPTKESQSFVFTLEAEGNYEEMIAFAESLTDFNRVITIEQIALTKNPGSVSLMLSVKGRG